MSSMSSMSSKLSNIYQIIDLYEHDSKINLQEQMYEICLFCIDSISSNSVCVRIRNYMPFFYIEIPTGFHYDSFCDTLTGKLKKIEFNCSLVEKKIFRCYGPFKQCIQLTFKQLRHYSQAKKYISDNTLWSICDIGIAPMLKFCHQMNIQTSGWIEISDYHLVSSSKQFSSCHHEIIIDDPKYIKSVIQLGCIGKLKIASFDIETTTSSTDNTFPVFTNANDPIIQIGTTSETFGIESNKPIKYIATLGECDNIPDALVETCTDEKELIIKWTQFIRKLDPDIIIGYNTFGYDFEYIFERAIYLGIIEYICNLSRISNPLTINELNQFRMAYTGKFTKDIKDTKDKYTLSKIYNFHPIGSSGSFGSFGSFGSSGSKYIRMVGRVNIDLLKYCRDNGDKLSSYKLDNVAKHYGLPQGKHDMPYKKIFQIYRQKTGMALEKRKVAEYCIQDCYLCNQLMTKLNIIPNCIGMSSTCFVPLNFLFTRGQGVKIESLLLNECQLMNYIMPYKRPDGSNRCYKGATVLTAKQGFYGCPVSVLDFASLYPSCMVSSNLCISSKLIGGIEQIDQLQLKPDEYTVIDWYETFNADNLISICTGKPKLYDKYPWLKPSNNSSKPSNSDINHRMTRKFLVEKDESFFLDFGINMSELCHEYDENNIPSLKIHKRHYFIKAGENNENIGIIPKVLLKLLHRRNEVKKLLEQHASNTFLYKIYNGLQFSYKVTAVSVYGQLGANFGAFSNLDVAASCTATGRKLLEFVQNTILNNFYKSSAIYGDTDSVFIRFDIKNHELTCINHPNHPDHPNQIEQICNDNLHHKKYDVLGSYIATNNESRIYQECNCNAMDNLMSPEALLESIRLATIADKFITSLLPYSKAYKKSTSVHQLEYEKTYQPFILFTKKKYVGQMYTFTQKLVKTDSKGIVLTRRDNCKLLKIIYEDCLKYLLLNDTKSSLIALENALEQLISGKTFAIHDLIITKTLRDSYKANCNQPHVLLAQRVQQRDPGNAFQVNERIPYCFIERSNTKKLKTLQSEFIETPEYIVENNIKLDYGYYIEKQLRNPILQLFAIVGVEKQANKIFNTYLHQYNNKRCKQSTLDQYFLK